MSDFEKPSVAPVHDDIATSNVSELDKKVAHSEHNEFAAKDAASEDLTSTSAGTTTPTERIIVTEEDVRRIRRATNWAILPVLVWIYFLQSFDKTLLGYAATYGLAKDANLVGKQYSMIGSIASIAQLCWLPFSSWLIVRVPARTLMMGLVLGWGS